MSSKKKIFKRVCGGCGSCESCKSYPTFKVSSCPSGPPVSQGEPEPAFTPVYGSLYSGENDALAIPNTNVDFTEEGPSSGVTLNTADDSITVNSQGVYNISFTTVLAMTDPLSREISFYFTINGNINPNTLIYVHNHFDSDEFHTVSRTQQLTLNQGDVIRVLMSFASPSTFYRTPTLVVTKVA